MNQKKKRKSRYRHAEGKQWIEVRVKDPLQLFDARDPAPFRERDLDDDFVAYISSAALEFSLATPLKIAIYIEDSETAALSKDSIREAIHSYYAYQNDLQAAELKRFVKRAQFYLVIGLLVLTACLSVAQGIEVPDPPGALGIFKEGLVIFGWVSVWKPIELILFDWFPLYEKIRFFQKLSTIEIDVKYGSVSNLRT